MSLGHWAATYCISRLIASIAALFGACSMKKLIGVLLFLLAGGWLVSCGLIEDGSKPDVQELTLGVVPGCNDRVGSAVSIMAEDGFNHLPLDGLQIKHRVNGGNWIQKDEVNDLPYLIKGPAGKYDIEVRKAGFPLRTATIMVSQEPSCRIIQQEWVLYADRPLCPTTPPVIDMEVIAESANGNGLDINLTPAGNFKDSIPCNNPSNCHFNIEVDKNGNYVVELSGFRDHRQMEIIDGVVHYSYTDVTIEMRIGNRQFKTIRSGGVSEITLTIPYEYGDSGCYEVALNDVQIAKQDVAPSDPAVVDTKENLAFDIEPYPSAKCPGASENDSATVEVEYEVLLPVDTKISDVKVEYWSGGDWNQAICDDSVGYTCRATYPNPFYDDRYQVRTIINDEVIVGSSVTLTNRCMIFK